MAPREDDRKTETMRVAFLNSWPNVPDGADKRFVSRALIASRRLGWEAVEVITSDDIKAFHPDCVVVTHEISPKLTESPTLAMMCRPDIPLRDDPQRVRNLLTHDGYLPAAKSIKNYVGDLLFSTRKNAPVADFMLLPSCCRTEFSDLPQDLSLYCGGMKQSDKRGRQLLRRLAARIPLETGTADGASIMDRIRRCGAVLCLHDEAQLRANVPSMRLFEGAAAGAVILTDCLAFVAEHFHDAVLTVDVNQPVAQIVRQIEAHMAWIETHPAEAKALARRAHEIFCQQFCLEEQLQRLPDFLKRVQSAGYFPGGAVVSAPEEPRVEYIVRVGSRPLSVVKRCLDGLHSQTYSNIGLILVQFQPIEGIGEFLAPYERRFRSMKIVPAAAGMRSTAYWAGLNAVSAPYFGNCDDDDSLAPNHVATVMEAMHSQPGISLAYSGTVLVQDEPGHPTQLPNFAGPNRAIIPENHSIRFFDPFDVRRLLRFENYVNSNAWIARRELLDEQLLRDPEMNVSEDFLLLLAFVNKTPFAFTWRPTANWHWRSTTQDNSVFRDFADRESEFVSRLDRRFKYARWDAGHGDGVAHGTIGEAIAERRRQKLRDALTGARRMMLDPRHWSERLWTACRRFRDEGLKGVLTYSAEIGRR